MCCRGICKKSSSGLVNQNHAYYNQVKQQLFSLGYECKDLVLSDLKENIILSIKRFIFSKKSLPKLQCFYDQYPAPEHACPRVEIGSSPTR